ncbi:FA_FANCE domain-containing protein [Caenorhabditis elegans]|uniref:FA_FANCE domain-containing protein n=1 Tax=Caenorhabditis elegans TaxID=6239 RepID=X5M8W1_CAEEL|nr:FA_FANCE domain-containing protein [Caenorhabditis elegans]CDO41104.1 FA_FANCE domain-containing protein [Caenorhabditis elegans]|eukprot:NP_001294051.1 Uncharacterized protein CELE_D2096.7 [Caenorhabditis elegans]
MLDGYQLLLKAQCSESLDLLGLSQAEILIIIENERRYDVKTRLCERIAFLIYQDSNFGRLPHNSSEVFASINRLCKSMPTGFSFEDPETFVGPSTTSDTLQNFPNHSLERILCATLLSTSEEDLPSLLDSIFSQKYPTTATLTQKLLDNDERFLTCTLALLPLIETLPTSSIFHPVSVFLEAMHLISYDCEVVIDWLNSELASSSLILRILKSNCHDKNRNCWMSYSPIINEAALSDIQRKQISPLIKAAPSIQYPKVTLKITEIVGDQEMTKTMKFQGSESKRMCSHKHPTILKNTGSFGKWVNMVVEVRERLRRLLSAKLLPKKFDIILKWCDKFWDIYVK